MAVDSESAFDYEEILRIANETHIPSYQRRQSVGPRRPSAISQRAYLEQTLSSRRRRSSVLPNRKLSNALFGDRLSLADSDEDGLTNEALYELLDTRMERSRPDETIHLPSDVLYRRRSRIDAADFVAFDETDATEEPEAAIDLDRMARDAALERDNGELLISRWKKVRKTVRDFYKDATVLKDTFNRIQGRFGSAMMEYFVFIKWLIKINLLITLMSLALIVPFSLGSLPDQSRPRNGSMEEVCFNNYTVWLNRYIEDRSWMESLADIIQGNGKLEKTALFYGSYSPKYKMPSGYLFNMSYGFIVTTLTMLLVSFGLILDGLSDYQQQEMVASRGGEIKSVFCNAVLSGWDHGLTDRKAVKLKKNLIRNQLELLKEAVLNKKWDNEMTRAQRAALITIRILVNIVIIGLICGCFAGIILLQDHTEKLLQEENTAELGLFYEYLPTAFITAVYIVLPAVFNILVSLEKYRPALEINLTLFRIFLLRFSSLFSLFIGILGKLLGDSNSKRCGSVIFADGSTTLNKCWENYIGQQIYKLVVLDVAVMLGTTYGVEYPRQWLYKKLHKKVSLLEKLGQQEFNMPKNVMDAVYSQTLCWIGMLFSPFIPLMVLLKMAIFFWVKKGSLFHNQKPSATLSKSSEVYSFFLWVMLFSLMLAYTVIIICIGYISPSMSCGPFRTLAANGDDDPRMLDVLAAMVDEGSELIQTVLVTAASPPVVIALIVLMIAMFYYWAMLSSALSHKIDIYTKQLARNVGDKQFYHKKAKEAKQAIEKIIARRRADERQESNNNDNVDSTIREDSDSDGERYQHLQSARGVRSYQDLESRENDQVEESSSSSSGSSKASSRHGTISSSSVGDTSHQQPDSSRIALSKERSLTKTASRHVVVIEDVPQADYIDLDETQPNGSQMGEDGGQRSMEENVVEEPPCDYGDSDSDSDRYPDMTGQSENPQLIKVASYKPTSSRIRGKKSPQNFYYNKAFQP